MQSEKTQVKKNACITKASPVDQRERERYALPIKEEINDSQIEKSPDGANLAYYPFKLCSQVRKLKQLA